MKTKLFILSHPEITILFYKFYFFKSVLGGITRLSYNLQKIIQKYYF